MGFTDHDAELTFEGINCSAQSGFVPGDIQNALGLDVDQTEIQGALHSQRITAQALRSGHYDRAKLELFRVNWQSPDDYVAIFSGHIGEVRLRGDAYEAIITGEDAVLERSTGRVFSRICSAEFGDKDCGLDPNNFPPGTSCPRRFSACRDQFANTLNFRGFPYLLGDDALLAGPIIGEARDGGSRYA